MMRSSLAPISCLAAWLLAAAPLAAQAASDAPATPTAQAGKPAAKAPADKRVQRGKSLDFAPSPNLKGAAVAPAAAKPSGDSDAPAMGRPGGPCHHGHGSDA